MTCDRHAHSCPRGGRPSCLNAGGEWRCPRPARRIRTWSGVFWEAMNTRRLDVLNELLIPEFVTTIARRLQIFNVRSCRTSQRILPTGFEQSLPDSMQTDHAPRSREGLRGRMGNVRRHPERPDGAVSAGVGRRYGLDFGAVFRVAKGKIAEWWVTWDNMAILAQLGHLPAPPGPAGLASDRGSLCF